MNPHSKPRPLFFTPRTPWGRKPQSHAHQSHMRASEDKKTEISPKESLDRAGVPRSLSSQTTPERVQEIQDASIKLPPYDVQRFPDVPASASSPKPDSTSPKANPWKAAAAAPQAGDTQKYFPPQESTLPSIPAIPKLGPFQPFIKVEGDQYKNQKGRMYKGGLEFKF